MIKSKITIRNKIRNKIKIKSGTAQTKKRAELSARFEW